MSDKRRDKRWKREHAKRTKQQKPTVIGPKGEKMQLVYRPKTKEESQRRVDRAESLVGIPFVKLPGVTDHKAIAFTTKNGTPIPVEAVEMVFNDALLMDAISNWGEDGPLTRDTYDDDLHREIYEYAQKAYEGVEIPEKLRRPIK